LGRSVEASAALREESSRSRQTSWAARPRINHYLRRCVAGLR
jgi:hypothetical protein